MEAQGKWRFVPSKLAERVCQVGGEVGTSLAISPSGTIYVSVHDGKVYSIQPGAKHARLVQCVVCPLSSIDHGVVWVGLVGGSEELNSVG